MKDFKPNHPGPSTEIRISVFCHLLLIFT